MLHLVLKRISSDNIQTLGEMTIYLPPSFIASGPKIFSCKTIELPYRNNEPNISCIPIGVYLITKRYSEKHKEHLKVQEVVDRTDILIHSGNYHHDTKGCILVGESFKDINGDNIADVTNSRKTLNNILRHFENIHYNDTAAYLTIV